MMRTAFLLLLACTLQTVHAQNTKGQDIEYRYIKLPLTPLPPTIGNYRSTVTAAYEAENQRMQAQYDAAMATAEAEYQQAMKDYPAQVQAAEDRYAAEMVEWEKKPVMERVVEKQILKENNKPVKQIPPAPYRRFVEPPPLRTSYDYPALASTYLVLEGYNNNPDNAVKVDVTMYGFEYTPPQMLTANRNVVSVSNGVSTTRQVPYYHVEFTYRHNMSVKVTTAEGKELFYLMPPELNTYLTHKTAESTTAPALNGPQLVKQFEESTLRANLTLINNLVNDRFGFKAELRKTELSYVKAKDDTYSDLLLAFNEAASGLKMLATDEASAKPKLQFAVQTWLKALEESDVNNKKARIDKDVTIMIHFNLLETYFALRDAASAQNTLMALNMLQLSNQERKQKDAYEALFNDLQQRLLANHK